MAPQFSPRDRGGSGHQEACRAAGGEGCEGHWAEQPGDEQAPPPSPGLRQRDPDGRTVLLGRPSGHLPVASALIKSDAGSWRQVGMNQSSSERVRSPAKVTPRWNSARRERRFVLVL